MALALTPPPALLALLVVGLALAVTHKASAAPSGTVIALYDVPNGPSVPNANVAWVTPNVTSPCPGCTPGIGGPCFNLPFAPVSGEFIWSSPAGSEVCQYVIFYLTANCVPKGNDPVIKAKGAVTVFKNFATTTSPKIAQQIPNALSVGCSFSPDPCAQYGCSDPNAVCISSTFFILDTSSSPTGKAVPARTGLDCSQCAPGYSKVNGTCQNLCSSMKCPFGTSCEVANGAAACVCPPGFQYNRSSKSCVSTVPDQWLAAINTLRWENGVTTNVTWNASIASIAANWTATLNKQCPAVLNGAAVQLNKIPTEQFSENDAWGSYALTPSDIVSLWVPVPTSYTARSARMTSKATKRIGCSQTLCGSNAFVTCLFSPYTG